MRTIPFLLDRTAVLAVGVAAGVLIGLSFHGGERQAAGDMAVPPPSAPAGTPSAITPPAAPGAPAASAQAPAPASVPQGGAAPATAPASAIAVATPAPPPAARPAADGTVRVGVFGDSFGDGVWAALYHQLPAKDRFHVYKFSQQATGFTRYRSLNLEDRARQQLAQQPVDVAVVSFGANDTQGVYGDDGHVYALMTPGWQRTIGARVDRFVTLLRQQGAAVYWVGLPVMRKPEFDRDIQAMNAFYKARMAALGVPWLDTRPLTVDASGGYAPYLPDPQTGAPRLMRAGDGIHMSMNGYERLTGGLVTSIRHYADGVRARAGAAPAASSAAPPPPKPAPSPPAAPRPAAPRPDRVEAPRPPREERTPDQPADKPTNLLPPTLTPAAPPRAGSPAHVPLDLPELEDETGGNGAQGDEGKHRHRHDDAPAPAPVAAPGR